MSNYNNQGQDPTFTKDGNAAVGQFYSSGGKNDSTGREPFEDSISKGLHNTSDRSTGQSNVGANLTSGLTGGGVGSGVGHQGHSHGHEGHSHGHEGHSHGLGGHGHEIATEQNKGRGQLGSDGLEVGGRPRQTVPHTGLGSTHVHDANCGHDQSAYGSNTAANQYQSSTSGLDGSATTHGRTSGAAAALTGDHHAGGHHNTSNLDNAGRNTATGAGVQGGNFDGSATRHGTTSGGAAGLTGDRRVGGDDGQQHTRVETAGFHPGSMEVVGDKFDSKHDSGVTPGTNYGGEYGQPGGAKAQTNQNATRHGDDFTGGHAATGGAYTNPNTSTGLTGRETTTTGVQDQHGQDTQKMGLMDKVKNAIGGHKNDVNANNQ